MILMLFMVNQWHISPDVVQPGLEYLLPPGLRLVVGGGGEQHGEVLGASER